MTGCPPIADYGLLGDTRTAALVSSDGAIDWMCAPHFDGETIFGRLVGGAAAGVFRVGPAAAAQVVDRRYRPDTASIETTWGLAGGRLTLIDGMIAEVAGRLLPATLLVRRLVATGAPVDVSIEFDPRLGEHHRAPRSQSRRPGLVCSWGSIAIALNANADLVLESGRMRCTVEPGAPLVLSLAIAKHEPLVHVPAPTSWAELETDEARWRAWCHGVDLDVPFREAVLRSLLTLRLLTYSPSGAPVAAPTTSLPEVPGGSRNWDYRFAWPRDASIGIGAFLALGKDAEASMFLSWLLHASRLDRPRLPVLLTLHGKHPRGERVLPEWPGYAGSRPVRLGNGAADQHQLDTYGWVLDAAWLYTRSGRRLSSEAWRAIAGFADLVADRWRQPDAGIWEVRGPEQHYVHSKLMAWLALDRALRVARCHQTRAQRRRHWALQREGIANDVLTHGFDSRRGTFVRRYGSDDLDAAVLVLPLLGLDPRDSPRVLGTIDAIASELDAGFPLLYRYPPGQDGLVGAEGAFLPCAFWLVQALAMTGKVDEARDRFAALLELATPLGLYAEEMDPVTRAHLGNHPQALTHAALVQAALALRDAERGVSAA